MKKPGRTIVWFAAVAYGAAMLYLLFGQRAGRPSHIYPELLRANLNLVPLRTIRQFAFLLQRGIERQSPFLVRVSVVNLLGNVLAFTPMGVLLPCLWSGLRSFWRFLISVTAIVLAIELTQLFTLLGSCDVDDLILNLPGAAIGYGTYKTAANMRNKKRASSLDAGGREKQ